MSPEFAPTRRFGVRTVLMSPIYWMRQPKSLFQFIHKYLGTFCFMPNFAFNHSVRSIRQSDLEGVDLSCLRRLINASSR
jgi:hypothetical protein